MPRFKVCLVVPSIRKDSFERFVSEWRPTGIFDRVDLCLMEDNPTKTFPTPAECRYHFSWDDIDRHEWSWIIPRRSDTVRSFGYWWAWSQGYEYLLTLDDDCYPEPGYEQLDELHKGMLTRTKWFNTLNSVRPRGTPYWNLGGRPVYVNHGLWTGVLDYDAPQQLVDPVPEVYTHDNRIVPHGAFFSFCGMSVMWRREAMVLSYHLMMGKWKPVVDLIGDGSPTPLPFDRFGDIWSGIIMKRVCDHLGWAVSSGTPYIHHDRASDPFTNLVKEAPGIKENETLWERIDSIPLTGLTNAVDCYQAIAGRVQDFGGEHSEYWRRLAHAMHTWSELFRP